MEKNIPDAEYVMPLVFMVVIGTVLLNASSARFVARWLGVTLSRSNGILFVGANPGALLIAKYLQDKGRHVAMVDNSKHLVAEANAEGIIAMRQNIFNDKLEDNLDLLDMGYLIASTGSDEVNTYACRHFNKSFGENGTFRLITKEEMEVTPEQLSEQVLFGPKNDFFNFNEIARKHPHIGELPLDSKEHFIKTIENMNPTENIPLFVKKSNEEDMQPIHCQPENMGCGRKQCFGVYGQGDLG